MKPVIVLLLAIAFALVSCSKEEGPRKLKIQYELTDNVSPVKVKLKVDGDFNWAEWKYNGGDNYYPIGNNVGESEYVFQSQEMAYVDFTGSAITGEKCTARLAIQIPPVASRIEFTGLSAKNMSDYFPVTLGKYKLEFFLYDPYPRVQKSIIVEIKNAMADKLDFVDPVQFDIPHFYDNAEHFISLTISRIDDPLSVFSTNFYLKEKYLYDRIYFGKTQIGYKEPAMYLETDWKP